MTYQSLYRKYRPQRFAELIGQDHVTTSLRNAVSEGRVGHAYLLSGPRGTGKTTTARILAKAVNCLDLGDDGEPCCVCENCESITRGTFSDLIELDAASNRGVDDARDLVARINLGLGATSKRKVYLLDEVHMLTKEASNTLLKTLEEPPAHVVFILATTETDKVLPTVRSRTQHFDFSLLSSEDLVTTLQNVLTNEGVEAAPEALAIIARAGKGSARDALSVLDRVLAQSDGSLTVEHVERSLGGAPLEARLAVLDAIGAEDPAGALAGAAALLDAGHEPRRVAEDLLRTLRDAFVLTAGRGRVVVDAPDDELVRVRAAGETLGNAALVRSLETLGQAVNDMRSREAIDPRLTLEIALVRLARRDTGGPLQALADRVDRLEARGVVSAEAAPTPAPAASAPLPSEVTGKKRALGAFRKGNDADVVPPPAPITEAPPTPAPVANEAVANEAVANEAVANEPAEVAPTFSLDDAVAAWERVLEALPRGLRTAVQDAHPLRVDGNVVVFGVEKSRMDSVRPRFHKEADTIRKAFIVELGSPPKFSFAIHEWAVDEGPRARREAHAAAAELKESADSDEPHIDLVDPDELQDSPPEGMPALDSISRLETAFGATVVTEQPR